MLRMPDAPALMSLGDRVARSPMGRDDALLACFDTDLSEDGAAELTLQARESRLLDIWERCFGGDLEARAACPECGAKLDVTLATTDLRQDAAAIGQALGLRSPTGQDLRAIARCRDVEEARALLLARCGINDESDIAALAAANPQADMQVALACALCGHRWEAPFEAGAFVWSRVERLAAGLVQQVHALAQAYHWAEDAILAMPERRRQRYLSLLDAGAS